MYRSADKNIEVTRDFNDTVREIVCVEGSRQDMQDLAVVELGVDDSCYIPGLEITNYITDTRKTNVKEKQMYKNKTTLVSIMVKYKVENNFNFKIKRLDAKRHVTIFL